jgi:hypothetical protein
MTLAERSYYVSDQEMLAIIISYRHWRHYQAGAWHLVTVMKGHHIIQCFMTTKALTSGGARWWESFSRYNLDIVYRTDKKNRADTPSRWQDYLLGATIRPLAEWNPVALRNGSVADGTQYSPRKLH